MLRSHAGDYQRRIGRVRNIISVPLPLVVQGVGAGSFHPERNVVAWANLPALGLGEDPKRGGSRGLTVYREYPAPDKVVGRLDVKPFSHSDHRFFGFPAGLGARRAEHRLTGPVIEPGAFCAWDFGELQ